MDTRTDPEKLVGKKTHTDQIYLGDAGVRLLYGILITLLCTSIVLLVMRHASGDQLLTGGTFFYAIICVVLILLLYQQRTKLVLMLMLWSMATMPILLGMRSYGLEGSGLFIVPVALMAASWVLSPRHGIFITTLVSLLFTVCYIFIASGQIIVSVPSPLSRVISFIAILIVASLIGRIGANALRAEFNRVKELAASLEIKADELQQSEIGFSTLFRSNPLPSLTGDFTGRVLDVNDAWLSTFGHRRENVIGRSTTELAIYVNADERQQIAQDTREHINVIGKPVQMRLADGSTRSFLVSTSSFQLADGWRYVALLLDQTDRLAAEATQHELNATLESRVASRTADLTTAMDELRRTQQELIQSEKLASLGSMVAGIAHELNTPVGNALMVTTTLAHNQTEFEHHMEDGLKRSKLDSFLMSTREISDLLDRNLRRTADLISSFKQVAVDQASEQRRAFNLDEVVNEIILTMSPTLRKSPFILLNEVPQHIRFDSYPGPLGQVLINLIHNALKHAFEGRDKGEFRLHAELVNDDSVRIIFADNGIGIPKENIGRIFDPFFTTKLGQGGSGLGLSIVHNIITNMLGGRIEVSSVRDMGTEFHIDLPLSAPIS